MVIGKLSKEQLLKGLQALSKEELDEVLNSLDGNKTAAEQTQEAPEGAEETAEETPMADTAEQPTATPEETTETPSEQSAEPTAEQPTEQAAETATSDEAEKKESEILQALTERLNGIEAKLAAYDALKEEMEKFTQEQSEKLGLTGKPGAPTKDYADMTAEELKQSILQGKN